MKAQEVFNYHDEIIKYQQIIIPEALHPHILQILHKGHQESYQNKSVSMYQCVLA